MSESRTLSQAPPDFDAAMGLVCSVPATGRAARRVSVHSVIEQAIASRPTNSGVVFAFENSDDTAHVLLDLVLAERNCCAQFNYSIRFAPNHQPIELAIDAAGELVQPMKALYFGLKGEAETND